MAVNENYLADWTEIKNEFLKHENLKILFSDYEDIDYEEAKKLDGFSQAAHIFIYSKTDKKLWSTDLNAFILMQSRFDGHIGFPGGFIDGTDASWEEGLNRELKEEIHLHSKFRVDEKNHFYSTLYKKRKLVLHFYVLEVSNDEFLEIERDTLNSHDWGGEVLGIIRPPLYEISQRAGLHVFLRNQFIGNSLVQFVRAICYLNILSKDSLIRSINKSCNSESN